MSILASAQRTDDSGSLGILLACMLILAAGGLLAVVPIRMARLRKHRFADVITAATILWACLAAGSSILTLLAQSHYASEHNLLMMTGYFDPSDTSGAPPWPWALWVALLVAYGGLVGISAAGKRKAPPPAPPPAGSSS